MVGIWSILTVAGLFTSTFFTLGDGCWFGPGCVYQCHCQRGYTCDRNTGDCQNGCSDGVVDVSRYRGPWSGYGCQLGNQAYGKAADQGPRDWEGNVATRAVDGHFNPDTLRGYCAHPLGDAGTQVWWEVDLGDDYVVVSVNITNRNQERDRLTSTAIEVSSDRVQYTFCTTLGSDIGEPVYIHVDCDTVQVGRYVRIRRLPGANEAHAMNLCEVQVYAYKYEVLVCPYGYFGIACSSRCDDCPGDCEEDVTGACLVTTPSTHLQTTTPTYYSNTTTTATAHAITTSTTTQQSDSLQPSSSPTASSRPTTTSETQSRTPTISGPSVLSAGVAAGIAIAVLLVIVIVGLGILLWRRRDLWDKLRIQMQANLLLGNGRKDVENGGYENPAMLRPAPSPSPPLAPSPSPIKKSPALHRLAPMKKLDDNASVGSIATEASVKSEDTQSHDPVCNSTEALPDAGAGAAEGPVYKNIAMAGRPVRVDELAAYIEDLESRSSGFQNEFVKIPTGMTALCTSGLAPGNKSKNRYNNVCAYDHSRVILSVEGGGKNETDYINANYIHAYKDVEEGNIAAQGPKPSTSVDMWRLVWQTNTNRIVMITKLVENGREKCVQYWPNRGTMEFGLFKVTLTSVQKFADYVIRLLNVEYNEESRAVCHFQFISWPDKGVPETATNLLDFHRKIRALDDTATGPQLAHCSAGIGRTGTFLAIDYLLQQAKNEGVVDLLSYTSLMRSCRVKMIQTLEQYVFVYRALMEALLCGDTVVADQDFAAALPGLTIVSPDSGKTKLQEQFELLARIQPKTGNARCTGLDKQNLDKNRTKELVPINRVRPFLTMVMDGTTDYINAAYISGYRDRQAYIVTQLPLPNTVCDLWRLTHDHKVNTIVLMHAIDEDDETTPVYWPQSEDEPLTFGELTVELVEEKEVADGACAMREFVVTNNAKSKNKFQSVRQFELRGWPESDEVPANTRELLAVLDQVLRWQTSNGIRPVLAQCRYGAHHSGLYVAASHMLERLRIDRQVDVFHAVKQVRAGRAELVPSHEQFVFLYELAKGYLGNYETYANFQ